MIGARAPVCLDARANRRLVAPRHDRIDQPVAAAIGKITIVETVLAQVVLVVGQSERALLASVSSRIICSGQSQASGPSNSRARAVCSGGTK